MDHPSNRISIAHPISKSSRDVESPKFFKIAFSNSHYNFGSWIILWSHMEEKGKKIQGLLKLVTMTQQGWECHGIKENDRNDKAIKGWEI